MALILPLSPLAPPRSRAASLRRATPSPRPLPPLHFASAYASPLLHLRPCPRHRHSLSSAAVVGDEETQATASSSDAAVASDEVQGEEAQATAASSSDASVTSDEVQDEEAEVTASSDAGGGEQADARPEDLENVRKIQRVLELLKKNRDMTFGEVKLTIMIEDPRDVERKRLLGIEDPDEITRDDLADALAEVNDGRIPENHDALRLLAKEMTEWPDLEVEAPKKKSRPRKSAYAKATDTGVDPETAAKRLNLDWDSAADIDDEEESEEVDVPPAVGYGALYLVTALPVLIGISVVLILFYNSLQ